MAEETVFTLNFKIDEAEQQVRKLEKARPAPGDAPPPAPGVPARRAPGTAPGARPTQRAVQKRPQDRQRRMSVLERSRGFRDRAGNVVRRSFGVFRPDFPQRIVEKGIQDLGNLPAGVGLVAAAGASAAFLAVMNAERLAAIPNPLKGLPGGKIFESIEDRAIELKSLLQASNKTVGDTINIAKAFGAIGELPATENLGEILPGIFQANRAQSLFQLDFTQQLLRSNSSATLNAIKSFTGDLISKLGDSFINPYK